MSTKLAVKAKEAFTQYSKKMCTRVTVFWMIYRLANFVVVLLRPEVADALVRLSSGADTVMIANMSVYAGNSICEKGFIAFGKREKLYSSDDEKGENDEEDDEEDEGDNG